MATGFQIWPQQCFIKGKNQLGLTQSQNFPSYSPGWCLAQHSPLSLSVQTVFSPSHCPFIYSIYHQLVCEDVVTEHVENLTKVKIDNAHCSPIVNQASHLIIEGYWIGKALFPLHSSIPTILNRPLVPPSRAVALSASQELR